MKPIAQLFYRQYTDTTLKAALFAMEGYDTQRVSQATCAGLVSSDAGEHKNITRT
ncbi:MAG: hypothetical protein H6Q72_2438 [Firmicutes bacterium]|nr:hypothetical protein [Bacillota bacterium]